MTRPASPEPVDFRKPRRPPPHLEQSLALWQQQTARILAESWNRYLSEPVSIAAVDCDSQMARPVLAAVSDPGFGAQLKIGSAGTPALFTASPRLVLALVSDLLGTCGENQPESRALTPVEESILDLLFRQAAAAIGEAWPRQEAIGCDFIRLDPRPLRTRLFAPESVLIVMRFKIETRFGEEECWWLLPQEAALTQLFGEKPMTISRPAADFSQTLELLTRGVPVEVGVRLGEAKLTMSQMARLRQGDVILLDQRIHAPLIVSIGGVDKFLGRPGRAGMRQAFEITSVIEDL